MIVPRGYARFLRFFGVRDAIELDVGDCTEVGGITVEAVPARHDVRRYRFGGRRDALGYLLNGPTRVYFAGDTDLYPEMEELKGRVDVALLPVSGWGPRVGPGHLDPERAARAAAMIEPRIAIPIHWGTLAPIGAQRRSDPAAPARDFERAVARLAPDVEVRILAPGERAGLLPRNRLMPGACSVPRPAEATAEA